MQSSPEPETTPPHKLPREANPRPAPLVVASYPPKTSHKPNQWPTEKEILQVSKALAEICRSGILREASGDYFNSGDIAYQMGEIIRDTHSLLKRTERLDT